MAFSFWELELLFKERDITIVGAGFAGLNLALALKEKAPSLRIRVLEAGTVSFGASTKNAGFFCFGSPSEILDDADRYGWELALRTVSERWNGLQRCERLFSASAIDLEKKGGFETFHNEELLEGTRGRIEALNASLTKTLGFAPYREVEEEEKEQRGLKGFLGAMKIEGEGMLNPYKLHSTLLEHVRSLGVEVLFGIEVARIRNEGTECLIHLKGYEEALSCKQAVIACNGSTDDLLSDTGIEPARGQVLITEPLEDLKLEGAHHMDQGDFYFRNVGKRVLLGGGRALDQDRERTQELGSNEKIRKELEGILRHEVLPGRTFSIEHSWSGIMGFTPNKVPRLEAIDDRISVMGGFSGMGVALSFSASERMADRLLG